MFSSTHMQNRFAGLQIDNVAMQDLTPKFWDSEIVFNGRLPRGNYGYC